MGETLSLAVSERPELYTAALHASSKWDGDLLSKEAYEELVSLYGQAGLEEDVISRCAVLDVKDSSYFSDRGMSNQHGGGGLFAEDEAIMGWLFFALSACSKAETDVGNINIYLRSSTVGDVINDPYFGEFGRLLFPVDRPVSEDMTLEEISSGSVYIWYNYIDPDKTVEIIQSLHDHTAAGEQIFYDIYSEEEKEADPSKEDTGLFFFRGNPDEKFAVINAGAGDCRGRNEASNRLFKGALC